MNLNTAKKTSALVHNTLLASVGIHDCGREIAANKLDQIFVDGSALVNDLFIRGESLEAQLQARIEVKKMFQSKITALKAKLGFGNESRDQQIDMLSQRVDSLIEVVAKLSQQKAAEKKTTTSTTKKVAAKPTATKPVAAKPTATKSVAAKPTATKSVAVKPLSTKPTATKPIAVKPTSAKTTATKPKAVKPLPDKAENVEPASKLKLDDKD